MSDQATPGKPNQRSLEGVLNELRSVLSNLPSEETPPTAEPSAVEPVAALPTADVPPVAPVEPPLIESFSAPALPPVEPARPTPPVFEVIRPAADASMPPPAPVGIETAPENWQLVSETVGREVPPPFVEATTPAAPSPSWLQPEAGIVPDAEPKEAEAAIPPLDLSAFSPPAPIDAAPSTDFLPPMPGSVENRPTAIEATPDDLDLEKPEPRPDGLVQVACLFPEGEEKSGQAFVNRLREAAQRLKKPLTVQPVFLHTWSPSAVDISAWAKSAALSGADAMFVIAPRSAAALFARIGSDSGENGVNGRLVALEHLPSAALYADVLVELRRRLGGPR